MDGSYALKAGAEGSDADESYFSEYDEEEEEEEEGKGKEENNVDKIIIEVVIVPHAV